MQFRAGRGVENHVIVRPERNRDPAHSISTYLVKEPAERLKASGACKQVDRHTARCPRTEDSILVEIVLRDRADRVEVQRCRARFECTVGVRARGGSGNDVLTGGGEFYGDQGDDVLRGLTRGRSGDSFHGGPGRDLMVGHGQRGVLEDFFYDDETDAQAARDVIRAGESARAFIDYSMRWDRDLRIDLRKERLVLRRGSCKRRQERDDRSRRRRPEGYRREEQARGRRRQRPHRRARWAG